MRATRSLKCQSRPTLLLLSCLVFVYTGDVAGTACHDVISCVMKTNEQAMDLPNYSIVSGWMSYFVLFAVKLISMPIFLCTHLFLYVHLFLLTLLYRVLLLLWDMYPIVQ